MGCAGTSPLQLLLPKTQIVYPADPPPLVCPEEPKVPMVVTTDVQFARWEDDIKRAGAICRGRLEAVKTWIDKWPKEMK